MNKITKYKDWEVWKEAMELAETVYRFDWTDIFNTQIKRAAASIAANIAEGVGRGLGHTSYHFRIAKGSCAEVDTFITLTHRLKLIGNKKAAMLLNLTDSILNQLEVLIKNMGK